MASILLSSILLPLPFRVRTRSPSRTRHWTPPRLRVWRTVSLLALLMLLVLLLLIFLLLLLFLVSLPARSAPPPFFLPWFLKGKQRFHDDRLWNLVTESKLVDALIDVWLRALSDTFLSITEANWETKRSLGLLIMLPLIPDFSFLLSYKSYIL